MKRATSMLHKLVGILLFMTWGIYGTGLVADKHLRTGTLPNGMTYTIKQNKKPEKIVQMRLLVKVGSLEEEDHEKGIAHFVEHMAFNGSTHYKKNSLVEYFESIGVGFGAGLNASTGYGRTLYKLKVPTKEENIYKALLFFGDIANGLLFDSEEFEKEKGVIIEEARSRNTLGFRIKQQIAPYVYANAKYKDRMPIGDMDVVKNAKSTLAENFWKKWYHPRFMHLFVVGDANATYIEKEIIKIFSAIPGEKTPERTSRKIPDNNSSRIAVVADKEVVSSSLSVNYTMAKKPLKTVADRYLNLLRVCVLSLFKEEAKKQIHKANPIAYSISARRSALSLDKESISFSAKYAQGNELPALEELYGLLYSFQKFGFSQEALKRVKKNLLSANTRKYKKIAEMKSTKIISSLVADSLGENISLDPKEKYTLKKKLINSMTLDDVNAAFRKILGSRDRFIMFVDPTGKKISEIEVYNAIARGRKREKDYSLGTMTAQNLLKKPLAPVTIAEQHHDSKTDLHEFTLSNGIRVAFKKTAYSKNSILLSAFSYGGSSVYGLDRFRAAKIAETFVSRSGAGDYGASELSHILSGTSVKVNTKISRYFDKVSASCSLDDLEKMFQLLYLKIAKPRIDQNLMENIKRIMIAKLGKTKNIPGYRFNQELTAFYYQNHPRLAPDTAEEIRKLDAPSVLSTYRDRFSDMNNFTFVLVGDADIEEIKRLSAIYLGNLPVSPRMESYTDHHEDHLSGKQYFDRSYNNQNIASIKILYSTPLEYSTQNSLVLYALKEILKKRLRATIREEKSGVYGINVKTSMRIIPKNEIKLTVSFSCDPSRAEELVREVYRSIQSLEEKGIQENELIDFKQKYKVGHQSSIKRNSFWLSKILSFYKYHTSLDEALHLQEKANSISTENVQEMAKKIFEKDRLETRLLPR